MPDPVLITGIHRSGSSWVGRLLNLSPQLGLIYEPFNIVPNIRRRNGCSIPFPYWFTYLHDENVEPYREAIKKTLNFRYNLASQLRLARSPNDVFNCLRYYLDFFGHRMAKRRPLMKDPIALLSSEWLAKSFNMKVIVLIRHPAAFVGSLKVAGWTHPFDHFLHQPKLMEEHLQPFTAEIEEFASRERNIVEQGALLWVVLHSVLVTYLDRNPHWLVRRHEDISNSPISSFGEIFDFIGEYYSKDIKAAVKATSRLDRTLPKGLGSYFQRDSSANVISWKNRLSVEEIAIIRERVEPLSARFYSMDEWN